MRAATVVFVITGSASLPAQGAALLEAHVVVPRVMTLGAGIASGDVNGDGFVDHVFAASGTVLFGSANGQFVASQGAFLPAPTSGPRFTLADIDGDGDLDACAVGSSALVGMPPWTVMVGGAIYLYTNSGTGTFSQSGTLGNTGWPAPGEASTDVAAGDVDGDGDKDLVVAVYPTVITNGGYWGPPTYSVSGGQNRLWLNQGNGAFVNATNQLPADGDGTTSVALADLDGDGDLDIYFGNTQVVGMANVANQDRILRNQGNGTFIADPTFQPGPTNTLGVLASDFDADGDVDVLVHDSVQPRFLRNGGAAAFTVVTPPVPMPFGSQVLAGDFDADGFVDFGVRTPTLWQPVRNVAGTFTAVPAANQPLASTMLPATAVLADVERDGDLDLLIGATATMRIRWLRNDGGVPRHIVEPDLAESETSSRALAIGDIDGDGHADLLLKSYGGAGRFFRNDGHGRFAPASAGDFTQNPTYSFTLELADFDNDGNLDAASGHSVNGTSPSTAVLYWNHGGALTEQVLPLPGSTDIVAGDLDGDGDIDLYSSPTTAGDVVFTNQGNGVFAVAPNAVPPGVVAGAPRLADIDGDSDLDVVGSSRVLTNNGAGVFTVTFATGVSIATRPLVGDFDGDQDVDFVLGHVLFRNNGNGAFTSVPCGLPPLAYNRTTAAGDFDGDGDLDVVRTVSPSATGTSPAGLFVNDGSGAFTLQPGGASDEFTFANDLQLADLDGDGDVDAVLATSGAPRIWWNRRRHLSWRELPRVGYPLTLDLEGRANDPFTLGLALAPTQLPIAGLGTLRLDPASLVVVAAGTLDGAGKSAFGLSVPPVPALAGLTVYWQCASGTPLRLGNLESTTLLLQ